MRNTNSEIHVNSFLTSFLNKLLLTTIEKIENFCNIGVLLLWLLDHSANKNDPEPNMQRGNQ